MSDDPEILPPAKRAGRPAWTPLPEHRRLVEAMTACGIPPDTIAKVLQINRGTLARHCRHELETGSAKANARVAQFLFQGIFGSPTQPAFAREWDRIQVAMFWLTHRAGWHQAVTHEIIRPLSEMSDEEIEARLLIDDPARKNGTTGTNVVPYRRR